MNFSFVAKVVGGKWSVSQCEMATLLVVPIPDCLIAFRLFKIIQRLRGRHRHCGCDKKKKNRSQ